MKSPGFFLALLALSAPVLLAQSFPKDSLMATTGGALQKNVIAPLENPAEAKPGGYKFQNGASTVFEGEMPPEHASAVLLSGEAVQVSGKGDFTVAKTLQGNTLYVGAWFYVGADDNVKTVGVQFHEAGGEYLVASWPADFIGWKWLETAIDENTFVKNTRPEDDGKSNGVLDHFVDRVSIIWWTAGPGPSKIGVTDLVTASE